jgi:hypothetical protein
MREPPIPTVDAPAAVRLGIPEYVLGDSPAAGANFVQTIEGSFYQRLVSVHVRLVTDGNVAARNVAVEYRDAAGNRFALSSGPVTQSASSTNDWTFDVFQSQAEWPVATTYIISPLKPLLLLPTMDWRIVVDNIQATDQLSRIRFIRERFYTTSQPTTRPPTPIAQDDH